VPRPPPPIEVFKTGVKSLLDEYFVSGVVEEAERALIELDHPDFHHEFVKLAISKYGPYMFIIRLFSYLLQNYEITFGSCIFK
jgi:hypothetical protein